jgi:hypothetical protein
MDTQNLLESLMELAVQMDVEIRRVGLDGDGGGLCLLKGKRILFVDTNSSLPDQLARTAAGLATIDDWEDIYILPEIREVIEQYR